mmetsp:Transcript_23105/g.60081  ORF Transcript_23105/g.60081 Transcript_23105/m.60081 type:complete len:404 (-) Transcript_23105:68-1279(-)
MAKPRRKKSAKAPTTAKGGRTKTAPAARGGLRLSKPFPHGKQKTPYANAVRLLRRVRLHFYALKTRQEKGRKIRDRDPWEAYDEKEEAFMDALEGIEHEDSRDRIEKAGAAVLRAYEDLLNRVCSEADAERMTGLFSAALTDDADPLVAVGQFKEAIHVFKTAKADREAYDALLLEHGGFFRGPGGGFVFLTGEQVRAKRKAGREQYAEARKPGHVPAKAAVATEAGHALAVKKERLDTLRRSRKERSRVEKALRRAGVTEPPDCEAVIHEGELKFVVKRHLADDVDDTDNPPSSRETAIELAAFFRMLLDRPTKAEIQAEKPRKYVYQLKRGGPLILGKWHAVMPWPTKKDRHATRQLINPKTENEYFDTEQEAIDRKYAWYAAGEPEDWLKTPKTRHYGRY